MDVSLASSVVFSPLPTFLQSEPLFSFSTVVLTAHKISNTWKTKMQLKLLTKAVKTRSGDHKENNKEIFLYSVSYLLCHIECIKVCAFTQNNCEIC